MEIGMGRSGKSETAQERKFAGFTFRLGWRTEE